MVFPLLLGGLPLPPFTLLSAALPQLVLDATPVCTQGSDAQTCVTNIIGAAAPVAHGIFNLGVWAVIITAILVSVWKAPGAIIQIAAGNSRVLATYVTTFGIIIFLMLLSFNSWTVLAWSAGLIQHLEPNWNNPIPFQGTLVLPVG